MERAKPKAIKWLQSIKGFRVFYAFITFFSLLIQLSAVKNLSRYGFSRAWQVKGMSRITIVAGLVWSNLLVPSRK